MKPFDHEPTPHSFGLNAQGSNIQGSNIPGAKSRGASRQAASEMIALRPTRLADLGFVMDAEQHPDNALYVNQWRQAQHEAAIVSEDDVHFIVELAQQPIGYVILSGMRDPHKSMLLRRIVILPKGKGFGRQTLRWIKAYAFEQLGYHRLWLDVLVRNERAQSLYISEGFVVEGMQREAIKTRSGYEDMHLLSIMLCEGSLNRLREKAEL
mgnify:CR=1 FL=1